MRRARCALARIAPRRWPLDGAAPLCRTHLTPLLAQFGALLGRHLPKPIERIPQASLLFRRHGFVLLPALPQHLPLLRRHGAPLIETLLRT